MVIVEETKRRRKYVLKQYKNLAYILRQRRNVRILNVKSVGVQVKDVKMMIHDKRTEFTDLYSRKICRDGLNNDEEYIIIRKSSEKNKNIMYEILKADWLIKKEELDNMSIEEIEEKKKEDECRLERLKYYRTRNSYMKLDDIILLLEYKIKCLDEYLVNRKGKVKKLS